MRSKYKLPSNVLFHVSFLVISFSTFYWLFHQSIRYIFHVSDITLYDQKVSITTCIVNSLLEITAIRKKQCEKLSTSRCLECENKPHVLRSHTNSDHQGNRKILICDTSCYYGDHLCQAILKANGT